MATPSLYRRYRPRRFSELRGQDHVVRALRDAVAGGREGQAYLFSGPRGTGKTTSARILAKVLNCTAPVDGEPCCACESCLAVERGTSYDVHELDAASNNGVDAMRDLIERASLGTPGRHKVYILDEVHMLSRGAEAALLKTLEEPPPHVVFVLATTDPNKVSDTIRSRTQHLRFHLLPPDVLADHIRWVVADAGLDVGEAAIDAALAEGAGSARDTLSALELLANAGGEAKDLLSFDEFVEALIEHDPGRALTAMAHAVAAGHEPRGIAEALVRHLRNAFLTLMAPELVLLSPQQVDVLAAQAARAGPAALVRAIERLGEILVELRHAPDPRVLVEVALVQVTTQPASSDDVAALAARLAKLEQAVAEAPSAPARPAPVDPATGRTALGGRARRAPDPTPAGCRPAGRVGAARTVGAAGTCGIDRRRARRRAAGVEGARAAGVEEPRPRPLHLGRRRRRRRRHGHARHTQRHPPGEVRGRAGHRRAGVGRHHRPGGRHRPHLGERGTGDAGAATAARRGDRPRRPRRRAPGTAPTALERLAEAFPGAEVIEGRG